MAKNNNLTDLLTDVANAIRAKKGTTAKINPQDFSSEIASISTGGGGGGGTSVAVSKSDVNFYDYDGTLLHSYTKSAFLALSALPDLPTRDGLTCQGWNYTLAKAKEYVTSYGVLDIGAMYITDDGKTRLYIKIAAAGRMNVPLYFSQTAANGVTIDWGDGSATQTLSGTGDRHTTHSYASIGDYVITLKVNSGTLGLGNDSSSYCVMGATGNNGRVYCNMLQAVEIGKNVTSIGTNVFYNCYSLASIVIPSGVTSIGNYAFYNCYGMAYYNFKASKSVPTLSGTNAFSSIPSDCKIVVPDSLYSSWTTATNWSTYASKIVKASEFNG